MKRNQNHIVLVSCGKLSEARRIAHSAVEARLAACVNIVLSPAESIYRWKGKIEVSREYLLVMKSIAKRLPALERLVLRLHSYDVPEFVVLPVVAGSRAYLDWIVASVGTSARPSRSAK